MGLYSNLLPWFDEPNKAIVDAVGEGSIMTKSYDKTYQLMEKLASNHRQMMYDTTSR